jgi:hypothetical protein
MSKLCHVLPPDPAVNIQDKIQDILHDLVKDNEGNNQNRLINPLFFLGLPGVKVPFKVHHQIFFQLFFPYGTGDFFINRHVYCISMSEWADHLLRFKDGRFAKHQIFKFVVHNMMMRKKALETSTFVYNQKLGDGHITIEDLKEKLGSGDTSVTRDKSKLGSKSKRTAFDYSI